MKKVVYVLLASLVGATSVSVVAAEKKAGRIARLKQAVKKRLPGAKETGAKAKAELKEALAEKAQLEEALKASANVNSANKDGKTALQLAAEHGDANLVSQLLKAGADPNVMDKYGSSPLAMATSKGYLDIVDQLLKAGASPNDPDGQPLRTAAQSGQIQIVDRLIQAGADPFKKNSAKDTILHAAAWGGEPNNYSETITART